MCEGIIGEIVKEEVMEEVKMKDCSEDTSKLKIVMKVLKTKENDDSGKTVYRLNFETLKDQDT